MLENPSKQYTAKEINGITENICPISRLDFFGFNLKQKYPVSYSPLKLRTVNSFQFWFIRLLLTIWVSSVSI